MLKLQFDKPTYILTQDSNEIIRTVCKLNSVILDSETNEIIARLSNSGIAKCNPEDHFDSQFGKDLALSRAKKSSYSEAFDIVNPLTKDSLKAIQFICIMSINLMREDNHQCYLFDEEPKYDIPSLRAFILANVENRLPLLRNDDGKSFFNPCLIIG